ncbi:MAG: hypothetical protein ACAI44_30085, partial [Candidatus Sericytochromatia bacterium]
MPQISRTSGLEAGPAKLSIDVQGQSLSETQLPEFLLQSLNQAQTSAGWDLSSMDRSWYERPRNPDAKRTP